MYHLQRLGRLFDCTCWCTAQGRHSCWRDDVQTCCVRCSAFELFSFVAYCCGSTPEQSWADFLTKCGLVEACANSLISSRYDSKATCGQAFLDAAALERFLKPFLTIKKGAGEVDGDMWDIHPAVGKLRSVWRACRPQVAQAPPASGPPSRALALPGVLVDGPQKIQASEQRRAKNWSPSTPPRHLEDTCTIMRQMPTPKPPSGGADPFKELGPCYHSLDNPILEEATNHGPSGRCSNLGTRARSKAARMAADCKATKAWVAVPALISANQTRTRSARQSPCAQTVLSVHGPAKVSSSASSAGSPVEDCPLVTGGLGRGADTFQIFTCRLCNHHLPTQL